MDDFYFKPSVVYDRNNDGIPDTPKGPLDGMCSLYGMSSLYIMCSLCRMCPRLKLMILSLSLSLSAISSAFKP